MEWYPKAFLADLRYNWKGKLKRVRIHLYAFGLFLLGLVQAVDPYALQAMFPDRWGSIVFFGLGVLAWALRKATDHPVLVSTTYYEDGNVTDPTEYDPDAHRLDDDGAPHAPADHT